MTMINRGYDLFQLLDPLKIFPILFPALPTTFLENYFCVLEISLPHSFLILFVIDKRHQKILQAI